MIFRTHNLLFCRFSVRRLMKLVAHKCILQNEIINRLFDWSVIRDHSHITSAAMFGTTLLWCCDAFLHFVCATVMHLYISFAVLWCIFTFRLQFCDAFLHFVCRSVTPSYISFAGLWRLLSFRLQVWDAFYISFTRLWCFVLLFGVFNFCWSRFSINMATFATNLVDAILFACELVG